MIYTGKSNTLDQPPDLPLGSEVVRWATAPMKIGKHEWRIIVYEHETYGPVTQYEYRLPANQWDPASPWRSHYKWRTYNGDDTYGGLPKRTVKLFEQNRPEIEQALAA